MAHDFSQYAGSAPVFNIDDSLVNISFSRTETGEHGFPYIPIYHNYMGKESLPAIEGYALHGPAYYLFGTALKWMFGESFMLQRAIHPIGLFAIVLMGWATFRRFGFAPIVFLSAMVAWLFVFRNWPMVRPDILIPVFGIGAISLVIKACLKKVAPLEMGCAMFLASSAFFGHLLGWSLPVFVGIAWLVHRILTRLLGDIRHLDIRHLRTEIFAMLVGVFTAAIVFVIMLDAPLWDQFHVWSTVLDKASTQEGYNIGQKKSYWEYLALHIDFSVSTDWKERSLYFGGYVLAIGALISTLIWRRTVFVVLALLLPSLIIGGGFQLSLGLFPNAHSGYALLPQCIAIWMYMAALSAATVMINEYCANVGAWWSRICAIAAIGFAFIICDLTINVGSPWNRAARANVDIQDLAGKHNFAFP